MSTETPVDESVKASVVEERTCPRCSSPLTPEQDWCVACGAAVTTRVERPPSWKLPAALVASIAVLALAAVGLAFLVVADDPPVTTAETGAATTTTPAAGTAPGDTATSTAPTPATAGTDAGTPDATTGAGGAAAGGSTGTTATPGAGTTGGTGTTGTGTTGTATTGTGTTGTGTTGTDGTATGGTTGATPGTQAGDGGGTTATPAAPGTGAPGALQSWPAGKAAWTLVVYSADTRADAKARADELAASGLSLGLLHSNDFSSLRSGYWVLFSGQYDTRAAAQAALPTVQGSAADAYVRYVEPR